MYVRIHTVYINIIHILYLIMVYIYTCIHSIYILYIHSYTHVQCTTPMKSTFKNHGENHGDVQKMDRIASRLGVEPIMMSGDR